MYGFSDVQLGILETVDVSEDFKGIKKGKATIIYLFLKHPQCLTQCVAIM